MQQPDCNGEFTNGYKLQQRSPHHQSDWVSTTVAVRGDRLGKDRIPEIDGDWIDKQGEKPAEPHRHQPLAETFAQGELEYIGSALTPPR